MDKLDLKKNNKFHTQDLEIIEDLKNHVFKIKNSYKELESLLSNHQIQDSNSNQFKIKNLDLQHIILDKH